MLDYLVGAPLVLAHRGGGALELENSATAFQRALALGVRQIETDVRATRDGVAVVIHDATLDRTSEDSGRLDALTSEQLRAVRLRNGDPVLTLDEALHSWPDIIWNVDVKCDDAVLPFLSAVARAQAWDRVCVASFSGSRLVRLRRLAGPRLATATTPAEVAAIRLGAGRLLPIGPHARRPGSIVATQVPRRMRGVQVVTAGFVAAAHRVGLAVQVWTINDSQVMAELLELGVDGLVTDRPDLALQVIADRAR